MEFVRQPKERRKFRKKNYQRKRAAITEVVKDFRVGYNPILHIKDTGDCDDGAFYGLRGGSEQNKERAQEEMAIEMEGREEITDT